MSSTPALETNGRSERQSTQAEQLSHRGSAQPPEQATPPDLTGLIDSFAQLVGQISAARQIAHPADELLQTRRQRDDVMKAAATAQNEVKLLKAKISDDRRSLQQTIDTLQLQLELQTAECERIRNDAIRYKKLLAHQEQETQIWKEQCLQLEADCSKLTSKLQAMVSQRIPSVDAAQLTRTHSVSPSSSISTLPRTAFPIPRLSTPQQVASPSQPLNAMPAKLAPHLANVLLNTRTLTPPSTPSTADLSSVMNLSSSMNSQSMSTHKSDTDAETHNVVETRGNKRKATFGGMRASDVSGLIATQKGIRSSPLASQSSSVSNLDPDGPNERVPRRATKKPRINEDEALDASMPSSSDLSRKPHTPRCAELNLVDSPSPEAPHGELQSAASQLWTQFCADVLYMVPRPRDRLTKSYSLIDDAATKRASGRPQTYMSLDFSELFTRVRVVQCAPDYWSTTLFDSFFPPRGSDLVSSSLEQPRRQFGGTTYYTMWLSYANDESNKFDYEVVRGFLRSRFVKLWWMPHATTKCMWETTGKATGFVFERYPPTEEEVTAPHIALNMQYCDGEKLRIGAKSYEIYADSEAQDEDDHEDGASASAEEEKEKDVK